MKNCRIIYQNKSRIWNTQEPLILGKDFLLEMKSGFLWVRNFKSSPGEKLKALRFSVPTPIKKQILNINSSTSLTLAPVQYPKMVNYESAQKATPPLLDLNFSVAPEDASFQRGVKRVVQVSAMLCLLIIVIHAFEPAPEVPEEIIPQKYAKLILTKPKTIDQASSGVSARSQSQTKAIARAFQSKTVQKSIKSILQGGLSKYQIMNTGRSIQSLSEKMLSQTQAAGTGLEQRNQAILGAMANGQYQIGSENGYGAGNGTGVKGQGHGQLDIGLNLNEATVDEGLTKEEVAKVIHSHMNEIRYCYESAIMNDPSLAGKVLIDFKIGPSGTVGATATTENTMGQANVGNCLMGKLKSWKFPNPRGGVTVAVSYPFLFKSLMR